MSDASMLRLSERIARQPDMYLLCVQPDETRPGFLDAIYEAFSKADWKVYMTVSIRWSAIACRNDTAAWPRCGCCTSSKTTEDAIHVLETLPLAPYEAVRFQEPKLMTSTAVNMSCEKAGS